MTCNKVNAATRTGYSAHLHILHRRDTSIRYLRAFSTPWWGTNGSTETIACAYGCLLNRNKYTRLFPGGRETLPTLCSLPRHRRDQRLFPLLGNIYIVYGATPGSSGAGLSVEKEMATANVSAWNRQKPTMRLDASVRPEGRCLVLTSASGRPRDSCCHCMNHGDAIVTVLGSSGLMLVLRLLNTAQRWQQ